ncbi:MAG: hypothetical protein AB7G25_09020 [Sphingomonadaceae bacterium]
MNNPALAHNWQPRDPRSTDIIIGRMRGAHTISQDIVIRNHSAHGLGARARDCPPGLGETVTVTIGPITERHAIVQWVRGDRFGLRFNLPLTHADREYLAGRADRRPGFELF